MLSLQQRAGLARVNPGSALIAASLLALVIGVGCKSSSSNTPDAGGGNDSGTGTGGTGGSGGKGGSGGSGGTDGGSDAGMCPSDAGGPSAGDKDMHCIDSSGNEIKQATSESACSLPPDASIPMTDNDAGADQSDYGPTLYGTEADDDDCKYHVKWSVSCVTENRDVTFNVTVTKKTDGKPLTGAHPRLEVFLPNADDSSEHPAPNSGQAQKETAAGVYTIGPVRFDEPGKWTARFHFREECVDLTEDSPHGHAAFYIDVP